MGLSTVYSKTGKGAQVLTGKSKALPSDSMRVLSQIDGKSNAGVILTALESFTEQELTQILTQLLDGAFIRVIADDAMKEFFTDSGVASTIDVVEISAEEFHKTEASAHGLDSDTKIRQQKEAETRAKAHAEEELKLQAVARAQKESERKLLEVADTLAKSEGEANRAALAEQEARNKVEAGEKATIKTKREAEARAAAEKKAREEAERKAQEEALAKAKAEAEARERAVRKAREEAEARARQEAEEAVRKAREEAERKAQEEALAKAKAEAEARERAVRKAREEAEARARQEAEEAVRKAREEAERKAQEEALAKAKAEAEARERAVRKAREEAEARARQEAEEAVRKAREDLAARAEREAETKIREAVRTQEEAERVARRQVEAEERAEAKLEAKREAEEKARIAAEEKARKREEREPVDIGKWLRSALSVGRKLLISLSVTALVLLFLLQLVNLSMLVSPLVGPMEKLVSANINEPVTINKVYASLWPKPHLVLDGVSVGGLADIKIETVHVLPVLSTVFDDVKTLRYIELSGLTISQANLHRPLQWMSASNKQGKLKFDHVLLDKASVSLHDLELPPFSGDIKLTPNGELLSATLTANNRSTVIQITPKNETFMVDMVASDWQSPIGVPVVFNDLHAIGVIDHDRLDLTKIEGRLYGGDLKATMVVDWANQWAANGTFKLFEVELEELMPSFTREASLKGPLTANATFTLQSNELATMLNAPEIDANFTIDNGDINGIDLVRAIQGGNKGNAIGGSTRFNKFAGKLLLKDGHYQYRQLALKAGKLGASGEVDILANQSISGKIDVNLAMQSRQLQAHLNLSGKLGSPTLKQ